MRMADIRNYINIITEGEVVPFKPSGKPVDPMAALHGADIHSIKQRVPSIRSLDEFTLAYIEAALWTEEEYLQEQDPNIDVNYYNINVETLHKMIEDCKDFQESNEQLLDEAEQKHHFLRSSAGHDFWLTRNGHGAGFWDRGLGKTGDELSAMSKSYGSFDLYVGDDGVIYGQ